MEVEYIRYGCISRIPIRKGDRVCVIICRIQNSLDRFNILLETSHRLWPACPVMCGKYDGHGGFGPDGSYTVDVLEDFFGMDMSMVVTSLEPYHFSHDNIYRLLDRRDEAVKRRRSCVNIYPDPFSDRERTIHTRYTVLMEHEDVVKTIAGCVMGTGWDRKFDEEVEMSKKYGVHMPAPVTSPDFFRTARPDYIIPIREDDMSDFNVKTDMNFMDFFVNYPENYPRMFDPRMKDEYIMTLKFMEALERIPMELNEDDSYENDAGDTRIMEKTFRTCLDIMERKGII